MPAVRKEDIFEILIRVADPFDDCTSYNDTVSKTGNQSGIFSVAMPKPTATGVSVTI